MALNLNEPERENEVEVEIDIGEDTQSVTNSEQSNIFIPSIELDKETEDAVRNYLKAEIEDVKTGGVRTSLEERWKVWLRMRDVLPAQQRKTWPWDGASNVVPPVALSKVNTIYAKLKASFSNKKPFYVVHSPNAQLADQARAIQKYLNTLVEDPKKVNLHKKNRSIIYGSVSMGASFCYVPWEKRVVNMQSGSVNSSVPGEGASPKIANTSEQLLIYNGPDVKMLRIENFLTQPYWNNIQTAPWVAVRSWYYYNELKELETNGVFVNVDEVLGRDTDQVSDVHNDELRRNNIDVTTPQRVESKEYELYETYVRWDINKDGRPVDLIVVLEIETGTILRVEYNRLPMRPIVLFPHLVMPGNLYPMGVIQMVEGVQLEAEELHNMRIDDVQLALSPMRVARRGSGVKLNEEYHPAKTILVDDPADFKVFQFPDVVPSALQAEMVAKQYASEASGANPQMGGFDQSQGNRIGATGTQFLARQGDTVLDSVREGLSEAFTELGLLFILQLMVHIDEVELIGLDATDQANLREALSLPLEHFMREFSFTVQSTPVDETEAAKRANIMQVKQLYTDYGQKMIGYIGQQIQMVMQNPLYKSNPQQMQQVLMRLTQRLDDAYDSLQVGETKLMEQTLEFFKVDDPNDYTAYVRDIEAIREMKDQIKNDALGVDKEGRKDETRQGFTAGASGEGVGIHRPTNEADSAGFGPAGQADAGGSLPNL
jgi:hypothetical protein